MPWRLLIADVRGMPAPASQPESIWSGASGFEFVMLAAGALLTVALAAFFLYLWSRGDREGGDDNQPNSDHG